MGLAMLPACLPSYVWASPDVGASTYVTDFIGEDSETLYMLVQVGNDLVTSVDVEHYALLERLDGPAISGTDLLDVAIIRTLWRNEIAPTISARHAQVASRRIDFALETNLSRSDRKMLRQERASIEKKLTAIVAWNEAFSARYGYADEHALPLDPSLRDVVIASLEERIRGLMQRLDVHVLDNEGVGRLFPKWNLEGLVERFVRRSER